MSRDDFLEKIKEANKNYEGKMKAITFIVQRGGEEKKIFKWLFAPNSIDFYISFPYYHCKQYHCGTVEIPQPPTKNEVLNAVKQGVASTIPVKFSYHKDGNIHFKPTNVAHDAKNKNYKLSAIKVKPIDELDGERIFTIKFEGLDKFNSLKKHISKGGNQEALLPVPEDIINFEIQAYAGPTQASIDGHIKKGEPAWFETKGKTTTGKTVYIGIYAILSRRSHIEDDNKNGLVVFVGFDRTKLKQTGKERGLYLFAR
ncbi:MAG: hypothetical protein ABIJ43_04865 [Candidatus Beckwithbacteria bacterium]